MADAAEGTKTGGEELQAGGDQQTIAAQDAALDADFGDFEEESPESKDESSDNTSDSEMKESDKKTDEEKAAEEAEQKEAHEKLSPEEKAIADKESADKVEADLKATYDKLSPEEKKAADDQKAEKEAREVETKRVTDSHSEALSKSEKRRADTERWAQGLNQAQLDLARENHILRKKALDPDYDPETDESLKDVGPSEEEKDLRSQQKGRAGASLKASYDKRGKEETDKGLAEYRELFAGDRVTQEQVRASDMPVEEAIGLVKLSKFFGKWGNDPDAIEATMRTELTKELTPKIREEESKRIMAGLKKTSVLPKGLSGVKGAATREKVKKGEEVETKGRDMDDDFEGLG